MEIDFWEVRLAGRRRFYDYLQFNFRWEKYS